MYDARVDGSDRSSAIARWAREPLVRFVVLGAAIFAIDRALTARSEETHGADPHRLVVSDAFVEGLRARHLERTGQPAREDEEASLIRDFVREEALYREARAAGLDAGDAIVRRRMVQKLEFLLIGSVDVPEPDDAALEAWMSEHAGELQRPARTTLRHVLFANDRRGERAQADALAALATLEGDPDRERPETLGDPFLRGHTLGPLTDEQLASAMGGAFGASLGALEVWRWAAPVASSYGVHVVRVTAREPARTPALSEVRERVRAAWLEEQRAVAVEREIARIVSTYEVTRGRDEGAR